jgi:hypothetical protein
MFQLRTIYILLLSLGLNVVATPSMLRGADEAASDRYFLVNVAPREVSDETFEAVKRLGAERVPGAPRLGVATIFSYLRSPREENLASLRRYLELCRKHQLAALVQLDGEQWWNDRPDLWNWWDPSRPGYDPANAANVEWSGREAEHALKIAWRNWGRQVRILPPPNLMSPRYRAACREEMQAMLDEVVRWKASLAPDEQWLFVGVKVGWESAIGMGSHYYLNGNDLLKESPANDPEQRVRPNVMPGRGFQPIGYAAISTAGLAHDGELREEHLAEVVRRHLDDLASIAREAGIPHEQIFTHCGGWAEGEMLYRSAVNEHSCPGWSFYRHGRDPRGDKTAMSAVAASDAPYWAVAEWLPIGAKDAEGWQSAIATALGIERCRYICAFNWRQISENEVAVNGIRQALAQPVPAKQ